MVTQMHSEFLLVVKYFVAIVAFESSDQALVLKTDKHLFILFSIKRADIIELPISCAYRDHSALKNLIHKYRTLDRDFALLCESI